MYKLDDTVIARIAQILQEAMLFGIDITDLMRMIELEPQDDNDKLVMTKKYITQTEAEFTKLVDRAKELKQEFGEQSK